MKLTRQTRPRLKNDGAAFLADLKARTFPPRFSVPSQQAPTVGAVICPPGPRIRSFVGRHDNAAPAARDNFPSASASADKNISAQDLVALLGTHTTSQQFTIYHNRIGTPQDTI
ncbi:hypothetical protein LLEC1_05173 [Akanthomyces lecanii]|uniref:Peroxidase n=1 Tax=Cordyceps confragosa TaxID=2714763 RepID=A0A179I9M6_CORDF|nr:hypothetical protein LLEC1_05173 [Akanthomyces lecanii]